jgi:fumarylpyruvate hydrolase
LNQLIWSIPEIIAHLSSLFALRAGDLIFTGTPAGVGPLQVGDEIRASIDGLPELELRIVEREA